MKRREFIKFVGATAGALPFAARAQQPAMPVVGFLRSTPAAPFAHIIKAFREGLEEGGFVEGRNLRVEQRWADNHPERLAGLADELVRQGVAAIVGNGISVEAARVATTRIPIVFVIGDDPVKSGFVKSLSRPGGNLTGVTFFGGGLLGAKRIELINDLVPNSKVIAVLIDPTYHGTGADLADAQGAGRTLGKRIVLVKAERASEFEAAFAEIAAAKAGAVLLAGGPVFTSQRKVLIALAARHRIPAIYDVREFAADGGLMSYAASFSGAYRQAGRYVARILKGTKPSELPVLQPTTFELVINLKAAKALGLTVPPTLLARADEVIE
jgi:putative ABC transport system substrate-binding protein